MKLSLANFRGTHLLAELESGERLRATRHTFLSADGRYDIERSSLSSSSGRVWVARALGKIPGFNVYTAQEALRMRFAPRWASMVVEVPVEADVEVVIRPRAHLVSEITLEVAPDSTEFTKLASIGFRLRLSGTGTLLLSGFGDIVEHPLDGTRPLIVQDTRLLAYDQGLEITAVDQAIRQTVETGDESVCVEGRGRVWIETGRPTPSMGKADTWFSTE